MLCSIYFDNTNVMSSHFTLFLFIYLFFFFEGKGRFVSRSPRNGDLFTSKVMMFRAKLTWYLIDGYIIKLIITFESLNLTLFRK